MMESEATDQKKEAPEADEATKKLVESWTKRIREAREHWNKSAFERMRKNMRLARDGADEAWVKADRYTVPILNRHINQAVSQLYARNPKPLAKRKHRLMHTVWDGKAVSLTQAAMQLTGAMQAANSAASAGLPPASPDPQTLSVLQDAMQVQQYNQMMDNVAETMTLLHQHYLDDRASQYKRKLKALVRRAKVCGVGYTRLGLQRLLKPNTEVVTKIDDTNKRIAHLQRLMEEVTESEEDHSAEMAELQTMLADLQTQDQMLIVQEGPVYTFPASTRVIVDPRCTDLMTFSHARWVAEEIPMTPEEIEEVFSIDVGKEYKPYQSQENRPKNYTKEGDACKDDAIVWRVMNRDTGQEFVVCDGYCNWLRPPGQPEVKLSRFWDIFPLVFNAAECEDGQIFPPSDVEQAKHIQLEYNRSRQALREHRIQNKPAYFTPASAFGETDKVKMQNHESGEVLEMQQLGPGEKIGDKLMAKPVTPIDAALYEVEQHYVDMQRVVGSQAANLGGTSGDTATESSIAEQSRSVALSDNVDDLDEYLSDLADSTGELMLRELSKETVVSIVGPGAVWPEDAETRESLIEDISMDIRMGSSGRPNQAAEIAKWERAMPSLIQIPGLNPVPILEKYMDTLEVDVEGAIVEGLPSIVAMNAMASKPPAAPAAGGQPQPSTGDAQKDPGAQGDKGAQNAPAAQQNEPQSQPAYPAPAPGI